MVTRLVAIFLIIISATFWVAAWRDCRRAAGKWTVAGKIYRRTAIIFAVIGICLYLLPALSSD